MQPMVTVPLDGLNLLLESVDMNALAKRIALNHAQELMEAFRYRCRLVEAHHKDKQKIKERP